MIAAQACTGSAARDAHLPCCAGHAVSVAMPARTLLVLANGPGADRTHDSHSVDISRGTKEQGGAAKIVTLQVRAPVREDGV